MKQEIYIVTHGEYSDYNIDAVFDNYQLAKNFVNAFRKHGYSELNLEIETWPINPLGWQLAPGLKAFSLKMDKNGNTKGINWEDYVNGFEGNGISYTFDKKWMNVHCFAKDKQHAIKIANEKRTQILANNQWGKEQ